METIRIIAPKPKWLTRFLSHFFGYDLRVEGCLETELRREVEQLKAESMAKEFDLASLRQQLEILESKVFTREREIEVLTELVEKFRMLEILYGNRMQRP